MINPNERCIFALDVSSRKEAERYVNELEGLINFFKVGIVLNTVVGLDFIKWLKERDKKVFLDLKYFDIPETVKKAVSEVSQAGVDFLTVYGDCEIIKSAVSGKGGSKLKILAVTLLTSLDTPGLKGLGFNISPKDFVLYRAQASIEAGADGIIASGQEVRLIRGRLGERPLIVTPGIRPSGTSQDDHKRATTPTQAIEGGADYLVIGRPIRNSKEPRRAAEEILKEMGIAFRKRPYITPI